MKMAKKFLAVALAGVLALSVLTGCGNSVNTKSVAKAMTDIDKFDGFEYKEETKLNTKAKAIAEKLADIVEELADNDTYVELTPDQKAKIMTIMTDSYKNQFVWVSATETKGNNATAQASNLFNQQTEVNTPNSNAVRTCYIGTTTVTKDGTTYRFAVMTAAAKAQTSAGGESTNQGSEE